MRSIYVPLPEAAAERLRDLARREFRAPKEQATVLILEGLARRGASIVTDDDPQAAAAGSRGEPVAT